MNPTAPKRASEIISSPLHNNQPKSRTGSARAKPLICYGAFLSAASAAEGNRALGLIFSNGRDRIKDAQLIASKRWRCSLNRVLLFHFDELGSRSQSALIAAEIKTLESLKSREAAEPVAITDDLASAAAAVLHQLRSGDASDGDLRDIQWCARTLGEALEKTGAKS